MITGERKEEEVKTRPPDSSNHSQRRFPSTTPTLPQELDCLLEDPGMRAMKKTGKRDEEELEKSRLVPGPPPLRTTLSTDQPI